MIHTNALANHKEKLNNMQGSVHTYIIMQGLTIRVKRAFKQLFIHSLNFNEEIKDRGESRGGI